MTREAWLDDELGLRLQPSTSTEPGADHTENRRLPLGRLSRTPGWGRDAK